MSKRVCVIIKKMKQGFTLLELIIGMTIFAIIAASVYTSLNLGIKLWKQEEGRDNTLQEAIAALEEMAERLRSAFINPENENIKFIGTNQKLDFFSVNKEGLLENLVFYLEPQGNNEWYLYQAKKSYLSLNDENPPELEIISSKVLKLYFSYYHQKDKKWYEDWPEESVLPAQVKFVVSFRQSNKEEDALELVKFVNIPLACEINISQSAEF